MVAIWHNTHYNSNLSRKKGEILQNHLGTWLLLILLNVNGVFIWIHIYSFLTLSFKSPNKRRSHNWVHHNTGIHCELPLIFFFVKGTVPRNKRLWAWRMRRALQGWLDTLRTCTWPVQLGTELGMGTVCTHAACSPEFQERLWAHCSKKLVSEPCQKLNEPD